MPLHEPTATSKKVLEQLDRLRRNIEQLGEHHRPALRTLADEAERHHRAMQNECAKVHDLVDDMRLREASVKFNLWAMEGNVERLLQRPGKRSGGTSE